MPEPSTTVPARVHQVIDVDHFSVLLSLDPAAIIPALANALAGNEGKVACVRALPPEHPTHRQAFADLVLILADVFQATLTPDEAATLEADLCEAGIEPDRCMACDRFSVVTVEGLLLCQEHATARDTSVEATA